MHLHNSFFKRSAAVLLLCALITGCADNTSSLPSTDTESTPPVSVSVSSGTSKTEPEVTESPDSSETDSRTDEPEQSTLQSSDTSDSISSDPQESESTKSTDSEDSAEPPASSAEDSTTSESVPVESQPPDATTTPTTTTTPATTTTVKTTITTDPPKPERPPAEVIIPDVPVPTSPGTSVIVSEDGNAIIDYSNANEGYISASYTGTAPKVKLRITCNGIQYNHNVSVDGSIEYFPLSCGSGEYQILLYENVSGNKYSEAANHTITAAISDETRTFLYPNNYIDFSRTSDCVKKAAELCAGANGVIEKIAAIFIYVTENVKYDKQLAATVQSGYVPFPDATLSKKTGICFDYASLFAAMARSQGIPTRLCIGYANPDIYHAWNEVYTKETGWITPELFLAKKGYNLVDATFYSGTANKEQIADYISENANYSVVYYY